jgi:hypothetical protein
VSLSLRGQSLSGWSAVRRLADRPLAGSMQSETTNEHEWTRIEKRQQRILSSGGHAPFGKSNRREQKAISDQSSLVFIRG